MSTNQGKEIKTQCLEPDRITPDSLSPAELAETEKLLSLANNRIAYIDERSKLFTGFENKDFQKISTCLRIGLGMDGEGVLASILQTDDARKKQKN